MNYKEFPKIEIVAIIKELKHKKEIPTVIEYQKRRYILDHGNHK